MKRCFVLLKELPWHDAELHMTRFIDATYLIDEKEPYVAITTLCVGGGEVQRS